MNQLIHSFINECLYVFIQDKQRHEEQKQNNTITL